MMTKPLLTRQLEFNSEERAKRIFDFLFALLVVVFLLSWIIPIVAIIIKIDSPGPVFFKQQRSGRYNIPFYCLKFRSMKVNAASDILQASKEDDRITRVGAFIRKTSIDELPQFLNVLMGEMSVVGPRPHMLKHTEEYAQSIENFMDRHDVAPGITGWAQVSGHRGETKEIQAMINRVNADIWYLHNRTFFLDIKIIFLTVWKFTKLNHNAF
ncbi:sugar transferase [Anditalea andensis]|uniref:Bacterial sugar transferase domain-containing protein n=1 Tax=Anditalea andensis TaxID=1048983 RepID=A0A074KTS0_9BACT|nr:sugar transferase [Anditalea andensis]KEO72309.1 hypothetical protein EL17_16290 [Anditalea andensis]